MAEDAPLHAGFLGTWTLVPESCEYDQGDPPAEATYRVAESDGELIFDLAWTDAEGKSDRVTFRGKPDGAAIPFAGGDLADELRIEVVSARDLRKSALYKGKERMITQLQLDDSGAAMRVTQVVIFPDGGHLANVSIYRKAARS